MNDFIDNLPDGIKKELKEAEVRGDASIRDNKEREKEEAQLRAEAAKKAQEMFPDNAHAQELAVKNIFGEISDEEEEELIRLLNERKNKNKSEDSEDQSE